MSSHHTATFGVLVLSSVLSAQAAVVPSAYATQSGGSASATPFSYAAYIRHQQLIDQNQVPVGSITGMAFRSRTTVLNVQERAWQELRVQLSHSALTLATASTNYAANHGNDLTEVFNNKFDMYKQNSNALLEFNCTVPFSKPFLFVRTAPLVVDLYPQNFGYEFNTACGGGNGTAMDFAKDPLMVTVNPAKNSTCNNNPPNTMTGASVSPGGYVLKLFYGGDLMPYGRACGATSSAMPVIGSAGGGATVGNNTFAVTMAGASTAASNAFFVLGFSNRQTSVGQVRLPLDLSTATPATNCWQNADLLIGFPVPMAAGASTVPAPIPNDNTLRGLELFTQFAADEPLVSGFVTTQGGLVRIQ
ncbi:MAG: hypothetical protein KDC87_08375 [Planctomycetes bacterium]|nr:hypothetical protein [Planctomycetota bacterium]MCB9869973.1 hypothetical protein [Planctomycetota bacterium]